MIRTIKLSFSVTRKPKNTTKTKDRVVFPMISYILLDMLFRLEGFNHSWKARKKTLHNDWQQQLPGSMQSAESKQPKNTKCWNWQVKFYSSFPNSIDQNQQRPGRPLFLSANVHKKSIVSHPMSTQRGAGEIASKPTGTVSAFGIIRRVQ